MSKCVVCNKKGEKHHIIFRSEGGLDIPVNFIYLCGEHHRGKEGPHKNRIVDVQYKLQLQNRLIKILDKDYYLPEELGAILETNSRQVKKILKGLKRYKQGYKNLDIIKYILCGKVYNEYMLDEIYDESWIIKDEDLIPLLL